MSGRRRAAPGGARRAAALAAALAVALAAAPGAHASAAAGGATGALRFRAMSPRDSDEGERLRAAFGEKAGWTQDDRGRKLRAEVAARLGVDFGPRPQPFVLELRPASDVRDAGGSAPGDADADSGAWGVEESDWELSGDIHELCERFLRNATVRCSPCAVCCRSRVSQRGPFYFRQHSGAVSAVAPPPPSPNPAGQVPHRGRVRGATARGQLHAGRASAPQLCAHDGARAREQRHNARR